MEKKEQILKKLHKHFLIHPLFAILSKWNIVYKFGPVFVDYLLVLFIIC